MKPKRKDYTFNLYQNDISNEPLIQQIRRAIVTLPATLFSYVIVDLFDINSNKSGIVFFQTIHDKKFKQTKFYTFEIRLNSELNGELIWKIYSKTHQTKEQVLTAFEDICVKRILPDLSDWIETDVGSENKNPREKNLERLKEWLSDYYVKNVSTKIDETIYQESLRYFIKYSDNYISDKRVMLAEEYCKYGQYEKAKRIYESTSAPDAKYYLANMIMSGKLGKPDYKLAYEYYRHTCIVDDINYLDAKIEIAKMHRDGKYFKADDTAYRKIIKALERENLKDPFFAPGLDKLYYELACIAQGEGKQKEAITYCLKARYWATEFLSYEHSENRITITKKILKLLYSLTKFDIGDVDFYDLLTIMDSPFKITFSYKNRIYEIEGYLDNNKLIVKFNGKYYNGSTNFLVKAMLNGCSLLHEADNITIMEVTQ